MEAVLCKRPGSAQGGRATVAKWPNHVTAISTLITCRSLVQKAFFQKRGWGGLKTTCQLKATVKASPDLSSWSYESMNQTLWFLFK